MIFATFFSECFLSLFLLVSGSIVTGSSNGFTGRAGSPACVIGGKIYVLGGEIGNAIAVNTLEVYDPVTDSWSTPQTTGTFSPRKYLTAAVVNDKIYAMGGLYQGAASNILEVFDPATNTWSTPVTTGTFSPRWALTSSVVNGKIYVMGGYDGSQAVNTLEIFDPATNKWSTLVESNFMTARQFLASSVIDNKIYVIGGNDGVSLSGTLNTVEVFDPVKGYWVTPKTTNSMTKRYGLTTSVLNGLIFAMSGADEYGNFLNTFEVFDPSTNTWSIVKTDRPLTNREYLSSCTLNGKIYMIAGWDGTEVLANEIFTPSAPTSVSNHWQAEFHVQASPNPTQGLITISYRLQEPTGVSIAFYNALGKTVGFIDGGIQDAGSNQVFFDGSSLSEGAYYFQLSTSQNSVNGSFTIQK